MSLSCRWVVLASLCVIGWHAGCDPDDGGGGGGASSDASAQPDSGAEGDSGGEGGADADAAGADVAGSDGAGSDGAGSDGGDVSSDGAADALDGSHDTSDSEEPSGVPCEGVGTVCDDGNPCTVKDTCQSGFCKGEPRFDDGLWCTVDCVIDSFGTPIEATSDNVEAGACLVGGQCYAEGETPSGNTCASCNPSASQTALTSAEDGTSCGDGNPCTQNDACVAGGCKGAPTFDDGNPCTFDCTIDPSTGQAKMVTIASPDGAACDDDDGCTVETMCKSGVCEGKPRDCALEAGEPCMAYLCAEGECQLEGPKTDGDPCNDANACTADDVCLAGECAGTPLADETECDDGVPCTGSDVCTAGACAGKPLFNTPCDDGDPCTDPDTCQDGVCVGTSIVCEESESACLELTCVDGDCLPLSVNEAGPCEDGNLCTTNDTCTSGSCTGVLIDCPPSEEACFFSACVAGSCVDQVVNDNQACDDGDACTVNDRCLGGTCSGSQVVCDAGQECVEGACQDIP